MGSLVDLLVTGIFFIFMAPMIYSADHGPIFFAQERADKTSIDEFPQYNS